LTIEEGGDSLAIFCQKCSAKVGSHDHLEKHDELHHRPGGTGPFVCEACKAAGTKKRFDLLRVLNLHMRLVHGIERSVPTVVENVPRPVEGTQSVPTVVENVSRPVEGTSRSVCPECGHKFKSKTWLAIHLKAKHANNTDQEEIVQNGNQEKGDPENERRNYILNAIPDAVVAVAYGRFQELCRSVAFEYDLPPKLLTARVAGFISAAKVR
jgi:DNA-directed RNA polymerase subunit RPC12/RpoP